MPVLQKNKIFSVVEYFEIANSDIDNRYEFYNGYIVAMAGASPKHNDISTNITTSIHNQLRKNGIKCKVRASDQRTKASLSESDSYYFYPDIVVLCEKISSHKGSTLINPVVVIEILSRTTEIRDKIEKWEEYRRIPELKHYMLVDQYKKKVELFTRGQKQEWVTKIFENNGMINLDAITCRLNLDDIYFEVF